MKYSIIIFSLAIFLSSCFSGIPKGKNNSFTHEEWTSLLQKHVNKAGFVDYKGFIKDSVKELFFPLGIPEKQDDKKIAMENIIKENFIILFFRVTVLWVAQF